MLYADKVQRALQERLRDFQDLDSRHARDVESYASWLDRVALMSAAEIEAELEGRAENPGAIASEEHGSPILLRFGLSWSNHEEARAWAFDRIQGITTLAVDGSQIPPSKDYSFALAAIQVAWFLNPHRSDSPEYVKDASFELLSPKVQTEQGDEGPQLIQEVNLRRFEGEAGKLAEYIRGWGQLSEPDRPPVVFFDGTLVASFAASLPGEPRGRYVRSVLDLLQASQEHRVPVVGFVDTSHARDLCNMIYHLGNLPKSDRINDGLLLQGKMKWGDRTRAFTCARDHILKYYRLSPEEGGADFQREVCFFYLQTTGDGPPARVDIPRWVVRDGLADYVADVVRCEVVAGTGYPYCFQAVDAAATLSVIDREQFYGQLQLFCERNGMKLRLAPKATSKRRRRV
jgi:hypothetical protein